MSGTFSVIPVRSCNEVEKMLVHDFTLCCNKTNKIINVLNAYVDAVNEDRRCINDIGTVTFNAVRHAENDIKTFKNNLRQIMDNIGGKINIIDNIREREPFIVSPVNYYRIHKMRKLHRYMVAMMDEVDNLLAEVERKRIETLECLENLGI